MPEPLRREKDIQKEIKKWLEANGWFVVKIHQSLGSHRGIADLYALKDGASVWIEVKSPKGRFSKYQQRFENEITSHGGLYLTARSVEDVARFLLARERKHAKMLMQEAQEKKENSA